MKKVLGASFIFLGCGTLLVACNADPSSATADFGSDGGSGGNGNATISSSASGGTLGGEAGAPGSGAGGNGVQGGLGGAGGSGRTTTSADAATSAATSMGGGNGTATSNTSDSGGTTSAGGNGGSASASTTGDGMTSTSNSGGTTSSDTSNATSTSTAGGGGGSSSVLLFEDFEDGNYDGWQLGNGSFDLSIVTGPAADDSGHSLAMSGESDFHQGLSYLFDNVQPSYISYWVYPTQVDGAHAYFVLSAPGSTAIDNQVVFIYLAGGEILVAGSDFFEPLATGSFIVNEWHHIEMDFDWITDTIDVSVNGNLIGAGVPFRATELEYNVDAVARLDLFHIASDSLSYWDEILVQ